MMKKTAVLLMALVLLLPILACAEEVVSFSDPVFEQKFREQIGRPEGDIFANDCKEITELHLSNTVFPEEERAAVKDGEKVCSLADLDKFPNLVFIEIANNAISDIAPMMQLSKLQVIEAPVNLIADISPIAGLTKLYHVVFWENQITAIDALQNLQELQTLSFFDNQVTDISALAGKPKLTVLELHGNPILDYSPVYPILEQLEYLDYNYYQTADEPQPQQQNDNQQEQQGFPDSVTAQADTSLDASSVADTPLVFDDPMFERALRDAMGIYDRPITQKDAYVVQDIVICNDKSEGAQFSDISPLAYFVNLKRLEFNSNLISDLSPLAGLHQLEVLKVSFNQISDVTPLENLVNLRELYLEFNQITDISALAGLTGLRRLNLEENRLESAAPLAELTQLESVKLWLSRMDTEGITLLMQNPNLHEIILHMSDY